MTGNRSVFSAALALLLATLPLSAQQEEVEIKVVDVAPGVHMLVGQGGNIGVSSGADGAFLIDDQFAPLTEKIKTAVKGLGPGPIRFVFNTHWHGDHTGGNENLGKAGALIVAHDGVRERMSVDQVIKAFGRTTPASPAAALPVVTFNDAVTFHLNGEEIHAFHVAPAHTDGDSIVHFRRANAIHMGDVLFNGMYPFIDVGTGGSIDGVIAAVDQVLAIADRDTKIIPGHGPLADKKALEAYGAMLGTVRSRIAGLIAKGRSEDEVVEAAPLADLDETWGQGFMKPEAFTRIVYSSLAK